MSNKNTTIQELISSIGQTIDHICKEIKDLDVVLCLDGASDWLRLSNGGHLKKTYVYTSLSEQELPAYLKKLDADFSSKDITIINNIRCTTIEQTLLDMLEYYSDGIVCSQRIIESLANYYDTNKNFNRIVDKMNEKQRSSFEELKEYAIHFYEE